MRRDVKIVLLVFAAVLAVLAIAAWLGYEKWEPLEQSGHGMR